MTTYLISSNCRHKCVEIILASNLWSGDQTKLIKALPNHVGYDTYKSVESVLFSNLWSGDKLKAIAQLL